jgi:glycosyltransferase involved in cell wall biosynthesis
VKILHLTNHVLEIGNGIVNVAVDLAHGQAREGDQVHFGSEGGQYESLLSSAGVTHHALPIPGAGPRGLASVWALHRLLREVRPDIVHVHMVKWAVLAKLLAPFHRYATVATVHNVYQGSSRLMGKCDVVVALGRASRNVIEGWGVPPSRIRVVVNAPLSSPRLAPSDAVVPATMESPSIVSVGGLYQRKGFAYLIEAFGRILRERPSASMHLVGEGPDRKMFEDIAARTAPGRIFFHGFQADPRPFLKGADVVVLASLRESFPLVLLEAREFGRRVVATDVDGNREALDDGQAGFLVAPADADALASGIIEALAGAALPGTTRGLERYRVPALVRCMDGIYRDARSSSRA